TEFAARLAVGLPAAEGGVPASEFFRWGRELSNPHLESLPVEQWNQLEEQMIRPQMSYLISQLDAHFRSVAGNRQDEWERWRDQYVTELDRFLELLGSRCAEKSQRTSQAIAQRLDFFLPEALHAETLSRKAISVLVNTPGVSCVLNG